MPSFLIVERDESTIDQLRSALAAEGWAVRLEEDVEGGRQALQEDAPEVVMVAAELDGATQLLQEASRQARGPYKASVALAAAGAEPDGADAVLARPVEESALWAVVRKLLAAGAPTEAAAPPQVAEARAPSRKLTSEDIFGDLLAEVEGGTKSKKPASTSPPAPATSNTARARARTSDDLDRELEKTLSGFLDVQKAPAKSPATVAPKQPGGRDDSAIDDLLDKTLSGLEIPRSLRTKRKAPADESTPSETPATPLASTPALDESGPLKEIEDSQPQAAILKEAPAEQVPAGQAPAEQASSERAPSQRTPSQELPQQESPQPVEEPEEPAGEEPLAAEAVEPEGASDSPAEVGLQPVGEAAAAGIYSTQILSRELLEPKDDRSFGHYTLLDRIAVGGMAEVWKARMDGVAGFQKTVAIKRILPHLTENQEFERMFVDEAKLAAKLNHPNIIHIYDLGKIHADYYIAMEYVEGKDLRSILNLAKRRDLSMPAGLAGLIALRLASALEYAHRRRDADDRDLELVHRDVSPQNVLISYEGDIKLCDFGIAKAMSTANQTQMGALKGKIQYMSPEQAWGKKVDSRSDLFSLGTILFEMLSGRRLFQGDNELSILEAVREARVQGPRSVNKTVPEALDAVVQKALGKEPSDRYATAEAFRDALAEALETASLRPNNAELSAYLRKLLSRDSASTVEAIVDADTEETTEEPEDLAEATILDEESPSEASEDSVDGVDDSEVLEAVPTAVPIAAAAAAPEPAEEPKEEPAKTVVSDAEVTGPVVEAVPPEGEVEEDTEGGRRWWLIAAILMLLAGSVAAFLFLRNPAPAGGDAATPETSAPVTTLPPTTPDDEEASGDEAADSAEPALDTTNEPGATEPGAGDLSAQIDRSMLERQAAEALAEQQAKLEESYAEQERELQRKLAELDQAAAEEPAATDEAAASPAPEAAEESVPPPATPEPAAESTQAPGGANAAQTEAAPATPPQREPPESIPATTPVATPEPKPVAPPPPPPVRPGDLVSPGPGVQPPKLVTIDKPKYPPTARRGRVEGEVVLSLLVDENGSVREVKLLKGSGSKVGLEEAAIAAARTARFNPAVKGGVKVSMWATLKIPFQL